MKRMLIISLWDVFHNTDFQEHFKHDELDHLLALRSICTSTVSDTRQIVHLMSNNTRYCKKPVLMSSIEYADNFALVQGGFPELFDPPLQLKCFLKKGHLVRQGFKITFLDEQYLIVLLNADR